MQSVSQIAKEIVAREGGFVNDPDDPGGPTKHGVTLSTLRRLGLDLTGDGEIDMTDLRGLSRRQARDLFVRHYFHAPRLHELPDALQASVFDMYVNSGANAVRILQRLLRQMGQDITVDGIVGPQTIAAAAAACRAAPDHIEDAYGIARRNYYFRLADDKPSLRKFARSRTGKKGGWIKRAEEFISPRFHMGDVEFNERVSAW
jgi:lysozyme family protein